MRTPIRITGLLVLGVLLAGLALLAFQPHFSYALEPDTPVEPAAQTPGPEPTPPDRPTPGPDPTDPPPDPTDPPPDPTSPPPDPTDPPPNPTSPPSGGGGDDDDPSLDLALDKQVSSSTVNVGDTIEYVLTITHAEGDGWADDVVIEDTLPSSVELIGATTSWGELSTSGNTVRVEIDQLFPGDVVTVRIQARVLSIPTSGTDRNDASVSTISEETTLANNRDSVVIGGGGEDDSPNATPTAQPPVVEATPEPIVTTPEPEEEPAPPAVLPETGTGSGILLLVVIGLGALGTGLVARIVRRRNA
jgi:uncharacterized repeat protein (TIGR01451 family)/LPXTG-motif cell wall-anchored protein